jgi:16S rRNA (adenine1518-N6/adenine1519-N6)-dimethyltransferase
MNLLAISVQFYAQPKIISYLPKNSFWPQPKVNSAIIKVVSNKYQIAKINKKLFFQIVKAGFKSPRKQLVNNLSKGLKKDKEKVAVWLLKNNIQPNQRAETLKVQDWINLTKTIKMN